jgi:hypothetical protein
MNAHRSFKVFDAHRIVFGIVLLATLAGSLFLARQAAMRSVEPLAADLPARPNALGKLAFQRLNFFTSGSANISLLAVNADGTGLTTLAAAGTPPLVNAEPAFSPDGAKIAYVQDSDIYVMNADGTNKINITNNGFAIVERNPSWSATNKIAYERESKIWTMNTDGSSQTQFSAITQPSPLAPAWSPDSSKMAFASGGEIWVINADGSGERRVTNNATTDADPAWSPSGAKIIFGKGGSGIAVVNLDGTNETNLTTGAQDSKPAWSSDGTRIAFVRRDGANGGIFTMDASGANQIRIVADQITQPGRNENDNPAWQPLRIAIRPAFDFDGDGKADIAVFRPSNGFWYELLSQNNSFVPFKFGQSGDRIAPADYDGDGRTDVAVFRDVVFGAGSRAYFYITNSSDGSFRPEQFGATGDVPVSGDWDGDGKSDLAVYRDGSLSGGQGYFFYRPSSAPGVDFRAIAWGTNGDKPVVGDFDGDGKQDAAVFRPSAGTWYILQSSNNQYVFQGLGIATDIPVPADYDGDGRTNIAVFRPSNGTWYTSPNPQTNYGAVQFGALGDLPVPADYDGDGRADIAVFRPSNGTWYLLRSTAGFTGVRFGNNEDKPIPNAFVP